jgi:Domain of unknown function (DUF6968)
MASEPRRLSPVLHGSGSALAEPKVWKPTDLGTVVAQRSLTLRVGGAEHAVMVSVGQPVREPNPDANAPWWCPLQVEGLGRRVRFDAIGGVDSLQSLLLALQYARRMLPFWAKKEKGALTWEHEDIDVIFDSSDLAESYGKMAGEVLSAARDVLREERGSGSQPGKGSMDRLRDVVEKYETQGR